MALVIEFPSRNGAAVMGVRKPVTGGALFVLWVKRYRYRRMLREHLLPQPDSVFEDAGMSRAEAGAEAAKPFWRA